MMPQQDTDKRLGTETEDLARFRDLRRTRDPKVRDALVLKYQGLAEKIARRFASANEPIEDLIQEAYLGLIKAVDRFDPDQGVQFSTYATHTISGEIRHYLRDLGKMIQEPGWHAQLRYRILRCSEALLHKLGRQPEAEEIAQTLDLKSETVRAVLHSGQLFELESLDEPDDESPEAPTRMERLQATESSREGSGGTVEERLVLQDALGQLKKLERSVLYHFFYQEYTKTEIARKLGISVNYTSYLVRRSLSKLKSILTRAEEKEALLRVQTHIESRLAQVEKRIKSIETSDTETGLATRGQFVRRLREEVDRARRYGVEFSIIAFHVKWPQKFDVTETRRQLLDVFGKLLRNRCRTVDLLARLNDTAFGALLPHTGTSGKIVGDRVVRSVAQDEVLSKADVHYRQATYPHDGDNVEDLLRAVGVGRKSQR